MIRVTFHVVDRGFLALTATHLSMMPFFSSSNINTFKNNNPQQKRGRLLATSNLNESNKDRVRIAIVGGGIAGITAAQSIAKHLSQHNIHNQPQPEIVVFEADAAADTPFEDSFLNNNNKKNDDESSPHPPRWTAATARNANSIVPGAAMHVMSQRSTLWQIAHDTVSEFAVMKYEQGIKWLGHGGGEKQLSIDKFEVPPPYFAFHVLQCVGPHVSWPERR